MSALADAIRSATPRADLATASPFGGLRRRRARTVDVVAQSIAAIAPAGVLVIHPGALYARSGSFAFVDVVVTLALVAGIAVLIGMFARRISSTGSLYTYTAVGLGPALGLLAGGALAVGYLSLALSTLVAGSGRVASLLAAAPSAPPIVQIGVIACSGAAIATVLAIGLRVSTRILLVLESIAVATVLTFSIVALSSSGWDLSLLIPRPEHFQPDAAVTGVAFALIGFVGFESGAALGPETRRPFAAIPRGLLVSIGAAGLLMLVGTAAQLSLIAEDPRAGGLAALPGMRTVADLIVAVSFLACALAMTNAATRVAFALGREGTIPKLFGRTSSRGVPVYGALTLTAVLTAIPIVVIALGGSRGDIRAFTAPASTLGFMLAYALVCLAAPVFLARIGELTVRAAILALVPVIALTGILAVYVVVEARSNPLGLICGAGAMVSLLVLGVIRITRRPKLAERVGLHDWPTAGDTIGGARRGAR